MEIETHASSHKHARILHHHGTDKGFFPWTNRWPCCPTQPVFILHAMWITQQCIDMPLLMSSAVNLCSNASLAQPTPSFLTDNCWQGKATLPLPTTDSQCRATNTIDMHMVAKADDGDDSIPGKPQMVQPVVPGVVPSSQHKHSISNPPYDLCSVSPAQPHSPQLYAMGVLSRLVAMVVFLLTPSPGGSKFVALLLTTLPARFKHWYN